MTLELLANILTEFAIKKNLVNYASFGPSIYELNPKDIVAYPILFISPTEMINVGKNTTTYGFTVYYIDRLLEDSSNETQIFSIAADTITNFLRQIEELDPVLEVSEPSIRLFTNSEKMQDRCAGGYTTVTLTITNDSNCAMYFTEGGEPIGPYPTVGYKGYATLLTEEELNYRLGAYTLTKNFATINGSGITNGGNIVIQGGGDYDEEIEALSAKTNDNASKIADLSASTTSGYSVLHQEIESVSAGTFDALTGISGDITELCSVTSGISSDLAALSAYTESIVIPDLSDYTLTSTTAELSAATESFKTDTLSAISGANSSILELSAQTSANTVDIAELSAATSGVAVDLQALSAYTESIVIPDMTDYTLTSTTAELSAATSGIAVDLETLSATTSGISVQVEELVASAVTSTSVRHIWYGTDADYQLIDPKDPTTLYIVQ